MIIMTEYKYRPKWKNENLNKPLISLPLLKGINQKTKQPNKKNAAEKDAIETQEKKDI